MAGFVLPSVLAAGAATPPCGESPATPSSTPAVLRETDKTRGRSGAGRGHTVTASATAHPPSPSSVSALVLFLFRSSTWLLSLSMVEARRLWVRGGADGEAFFVWLAKQGGGRGRTRPRRVVLALENEAGGFTRLRSETKRPVLLVFF